MRKAKKSVRTLSDPGRGIPRHLGVAGSRVVQRGGVVGSEPTPQSSPARRAAETAPPLDCTGVERYHDFRIGSESAADASKTSRPAAPPPPVGAGRGFRGI